MAKQKDKKKSKSGAKKHADTTKKVKKHKGAKTAPETALNAPVGPEGVTHTREPEEPVVAPSEPTALPEAVLTQPLLPQQPVTTVPDAWALDVENRALIFESTGNRLVTVPLSPEFLEQLLPQLNKMYIASSEAATEWQIRVPDSTELPPVLSLVKNDTVAASLALTEDTLAELDGALRTYYVPPGEKSVSPWKRLGAWYLRHRRIGTLLVILLLPVVLFFLYSVGVQLFTLS